MASVCVILAQFMCIYLCRAEEINIARDKPVNMSSIHDDRFPPEKAVDGITIANVNSIILTSSWTTTPAWWWVNLQTQVQDATVTIYFRIDGGRLRRDGVKLYTSTIFSTNPVGRLCHTFTGANIPDVGSGNCTGTWRYLLVYKTTTAVGNTDKGPLLDFGEVEVLVCSNGTYGQNCTKACSSRRCIMPSLSCDRYTGTCLGGCKAGWMGTDCMTACPNNLYGANCTNSCSSRNCIVSSTTCDAITGECPGGCKSGWREIDCTEVCLSGTYGQNCSGLCSSRQCVEPSSTCDRFTGVCPEGCKAGWMGTDCTQVCSNGTYGLNCDGSCESHQCAVTSVPCNHITGACPPGGCNPGWTGVNCAQACVDTYGPECRMSCDDRQCVGSPSSCHHVTGTCADGCKPGWSGVDCSRSQSVDSTSTVTAYVIGAIIGAFVMLALIGGVLIILFRIGRLQCKKTPFSGSCEREMTAGSTQPSQSVSAHIYNNDYSVLGVDVKSENHVYDDMKSKQYENI